MRCEDYEKEKVYFSKFFVSVLCNTAKSAHFSVNKTPILAFRRLNILRSALLLLHRQRDPLLRNVHAQHADLDDIPDLDRLGGMLDITVRKM